MQLSWSGKDWRRVRKAYLGCIHNRFGGTGATPAHGGKWQQMSSGPASGLEDDARLELSNWRQRTSTGWLQRKAGALAILTILTSLPCRVNFVHEGMLDHVGRSASRARWRVAQKDSVNRRSSSGVVVGHGECRVGRRWCRWRCTSWERCETGAHAWRRATRGRVQPRGWCISFGWTTVDRIGGKHDLKPTASTRGGVGSISRRLQRT